MLNRKDPASRAPPPGAEPRSARRPHAADPAPDHQLEGGPRPRRAVLSGLGSKTARATRPNRTPLPRALAKSGDVLAVLTDALKSRSPAIRAASVEALSQFGIRPRGVPRIRELLEDRSVAVRDAAGAAIRKIERPPSRPRTRSLEECPGIDTGIRVPAAELCGPGHK